MDLVLKGRGIRITDRIRELTGHKLAKMSRLDSRVRAVEVQSIEEQTPVVEANTRVNVACWSARRVFRAAGAGHGIDAALDEAVAHLERQITSYRGKLLHRRQAGPPG